MFFGVASYLFFYALIVCAFNFFKNFGVYYAKVSLILFSSFLIFAWSPPVLLICIFVTLYAYVVNLAVNRLNIIKYYKLLIFLPLIMSKFSFFENVVDSFLLSMGGAPRNPAVILISSLGLGFYSLKLYITAIKNEKLSLIDWILTSVYLPAFQMGPIYSGKLLADQIGKVQINFVLVLEGLYRLIVGLIFIFVCTHYTNILYSFLTSEKSILVSVGNLNDKTIIEIIFVSYFNFAILFFNFSGFSHLAIGLSLFIGVKLPENFNKPYIALNISDFWKRWHMSLGQVISKHIFNPLVRNFGRPVISIIITFLIIGVWHEMNLGYLVWGLAHGAFMGIFIVYGSNKYTSYLKNKSIYYKYSLNFLGWFTTMTFVSGVSLFANNYLLFI